MCVILHAKKKKHLTREELVQAMKNNNSGYFMAVLHGDSTREIIRTLDDEELLKFFDKAKEDEELVCHCRIPSRGEKNLENVHGWEEDGILFSHNMTIAAIDDMMKGLGWKGTDSEFFFRRIFIPYFRGLGETAYKDGKFHPDLDAFVKHFVGYNNKFCFVMPDNTVLRYGQWINEPARKENGETAFYASNPSYVVYKPKWPETKGGQRGTVVSGFSCHADDYDARSWWNGSYQTAGQGVQRRETEEEEAKRLGKMLRDEIGDLQLLQIALWHLAAEGYTEYRSVVTNEDGENVNSTFYETDQVDTTMRDSFPSFMTETSYDGLVDALTEAATGLSDIDEFVDADLIDCGYEPEDIEKITVKYRSELEDDVITAFTVSYSESIARDFFAYGNGTKYLPTWPASHHIDNAIKDFRTDSAIWQRIHQLTLDWDADTVDQFPVAFDMCKSRQGNWSTHRVAPEDILVPETMVEDDALAALRVLFERVRKLREEVKASKAGKGEKK